MYRIRHILFATDFSPATEPAFGRAVDLARASGATLEVLHVIEPPAAIGTDPFWSVGSYQVLEEAARSWAQRHLDEVVHRIHLAKIEGKGTLRIGVPFREIIRVAEDDKVDLIVLGTEGRSGISRLFLGSVAAHVVASAPCPVLTVRSVLVEKPETEEVPAQPETAEIAAGR